MVWLRLVLLGCVAITVSARHLHDIGECECYLLAVRSVQYL